MNQNKLLALLKLHGDTQKMLADAIGITGSTLNYKLHEKGTSFTQPEILVIKKRYNLSAKDIDEIFFSQ